MRRPYNLAILATLFALPYAHAQLLEDIYPWVPLEKKEISDKVKYLAEDENVLTNFNQIQAKKLQYSGKTKNQPWSGPYWPLKQGMIANPYQERTIFSMKDYIPLIDGISPYAKRKNYVLTRTAQLTEKEIARLAPSEKYDLLLGNDLDLSTKIWDFVNNWKDDMKWNYLRSIDMPGDGFVIKKKNYIVANWEGICHGWAPAAGVVPKPQKTVIARLPDGRAVPFYPEDIKGLISLTWANSIVQDHVLSEGLRCKRMRPKKDKYGRYYDTIPEVVTKWNEETGESEESEEVLSRCADIHPAIMHLALVNIVGAQQRSFVVDKAAKIAVANQPVAGYSFKYFDPYTGKDGNSLTSVAPFDPSQDLYANNRHPETQYVVGVESTIHYADWLMTKKPNNKKYNVDKYSDLVSLYDLELDAQGNIIGGQWRGYKNLKKRSGKSVKSRPDFLWVVPKDYSKYFKGVADLEEWSISSGKPAPQSWKEASLTAHSFVFKNSKDIGNAEICKVINKETKEVQEVSCEFNYPRPQPLFQVVNELIEQSK